jgi:outer membrane lipoprotein-sorting protein
MSMRMRSAVLNQFQLGSLIQRSAETLARRGSRQTTVCNLQLKTALLLFCSFSLCAAYAQPKGYKQLANVAAFQQSLAKSTAALQTLQSDFVQTKHLSLLADKITSKGKFYYRKEDKVRIEYTSPFQYLLVMNGGQILVKDEQKTSHINARSSRMMQSINRIMIDCMRGSVFANQEFKVSAFENGGGYLLSLAPANDAMKKMFKQIDVYLTKTSLDVDRLTMTEQGGDYTDMDFTHAQHNIALNDALFKVR